MISVIIPFWYRQKELDRIIDQFIDFYSDLNIEIVVVDDGCNPRAKINKQTKFPVKIINMPEKNEALNPCTVINRGVKEAVGEIILLTNPEIIFNENVIEKLLFQLTSDNVYVSASTLDRKTNTWLSHPTEKLNCGPIPKNSSLHFCAMFHKSLFNKVGGFDESYREGSAWEDADFLWRLWAVDTQFKTLDDVIVYHEQTRGSNWSRSSNRDLFFKKWPEVRKHCRPNTQ